MTYETYEHFQLLQTILSEAASRGRMGVDTTGSERPTLPGSSYIIHQNRVKCQL